MERRLALILVSCLVFAAVAEAGMVGGWKPINDPKHAHLKEIGEFAVSENNKKANTDLVLVQVVSGEMQVVSGMKYRLVLSVKSKKGGKPSNYAAVVEQDASRTKKILSSFTIVHETGFKH